MALLASSDDNKNLPRPLSTPQPIALRFIFFLRRNLVAILSRKMRCTYLSTNYFIGQSNSAWTIYCLKQSKRRKKHKEFHARKQTIDTMDY